MELLSRMNIHGTWVNVFCNVQRAYIKSFFNFEEKLMFAKQILHINEVFGQNQTCYMLSHLLGLGFPTLTRAQITCGTIRRLVCVGASIYVLRLVIFLNFSTHYFFLFLFFRLQPKII
jgi:hypothetical protein